MNDKTDEGIHVENVTAWFQENIAGVTPPLTFSLITGGRSNLTYRVEDAKNNVYVLRRPPLGHVLESAHNMGREHKIISALGRTDIPVAPALGLCLDKEVNGTDFYIMGFVDGKVYLDSADGESVPFAERKPLCINVIDTLVRLHKINPDDIGLGDLGKKEDYVARQVKRWTRQYADTKTEEIPEMEEVGRLLGENIPVQVGATIAHGDYRFGNLMINNYRVAAILDWELCTLGDPLADFGYLLNWWLGPDEEGPGSVDDEPTSVDGFISRDEVIEYYGTHTGRDLSNIQYYRALSYWRLASISQGVYRRYLDGAMRDSSPEVIKRYYDNVHRLSKMAMNAVS